MRIREGRFQRWLALMAGASSVLSGLEVAYEHYRGGYSRRIMVTPVILSGALAIAGVAGFRNAIAARTVLPLVSILTGADAALGFYFHVRGIARKPGGWRLPIVNIVMGPPIFAPLLFATSAYLGIIASQLKRSGDDEEHGLPYAAHAKHWAARLRGHHEPIDARQDLREGRFQKHLAVATVVAAGFSGFEAWYSHYKNNFRYRAQWTPVVIAPLLMLAAGGAIARVRVAHTWLPAISALAVIDGSVGFFYHARGVLRRPGGRALLFYNIVYGPPIFAPLLFAASGFLGLLSSLLRREPK
jgi:type IV secretory pathway VirB2 component (pilin)